MRRPAAIILSMAGVISSCSRPTPSDVASAADVPITARLAHASVDRGAGLFQRCAACHTIGKGSGDRDGPNLYGVVGQAVGHNSPSFAYTSALQGVGGIWTPDRLDRWLTAPQRFAPGTQMSFPGLPNGADRADVIAYLTANGPKVSTPHTVSGIGHSGVASVDDGRP